MPIIEHADVRRMLLAQKAYVEGALGAGAVLRRLVDEQRTAETPEARAHARLLLDVLTPIAKSWPSQWCLEANDLAIQVHGGYGYTREYDVEQHYRDNRLNPIHEGTHGIQALDLLGRKVVMDGGAGLDACSARPSARRSTRRWPPAARPPNWAPRCGGAGPGREGHRRVCGRPATRGAPGQRVRLPGGGRPRRHGVDLAGAVPADGGRDDAFHRGQAAGGPLLLPLRTAPHRTAVRPAGLARHDDVETDPDWF